MEAELATMDGQIREMAAQMEPLKQAKTAAHAAHQARLFIVYFVLFGLLFFYFSVVFAHS